MVGAEEKGVIYSGGDYLMWRFVLFIEY